MKIIVIGSTLHTKRCIEELVKSSEDSIEALIALDEYGATRKARWTTFEDQAEKYGFELYKTRKLNDRTIIDVVKKINPDIIFEFGSSLIVPPQILDIPKYGCIGSHGAELPYIRGGSSLNWALIRGEKKWGVSLYYLSKKVDEGDVIATKSFDIDLRDDIKTLHDKSDNAVVELLREYFPLIKENKEPRIIQKDEDFIYLPNRKPKDGLINWNNKTMDIYNWIRALTHPFPGAFTFYDNKKIYVWKSDYTNYSNFNDAYGQIIDRKDKEGILVAARDGSMVLQRLQFENDIEMWADDFFLKYNLKRGDTFD